MKHYIFQIKLVAVGWVSLIMIGLSGYCLFFGSAHHSQEPIYSNSLELPLNFPSTKVTYSLLTPIERKASVSTYDHLIRAACRKHKIDPALVKAVIHAESGFDPLAVSPRGAMGLMQIDPVTARQLGITDSFDPKKNIDGGVRYLKELLETFEGDKRLALAAYNAGPNRVQVHRGVPPFKNTEKFLAQVFRYHNYYLREKAS